MTASRRSRTWCLQGSRVAVAAACSALLLLGCRGSAATPDRPEPDAAAARALVAALDAQAPPGASGELVVLLAFGAAADLDLFVTAPDQETVYFANSPTRLGGTLDADLRCERTGPAVERVRFPEAIAGVYRVGLDFPRRCDEGDDEVAYAVRLMRGDLRRDALGTIRPGEFLVRVLEVPVSPAASR